jgi:hypothetical protein
MAREPERTALRAIKLPLTRAFPGDFDQTCRKLQSGEEKIRSFEVQGLARISQATINDGCPAGPIGPRCCAAG